MNEKSAEIFGPVKIERSYIWDDGTEDESMSGEDETELNVVDHQPGKFEVSVGLVTSLSTSGPDGPSAVKFRYCVKVTGVEIIY
jgi:hypothetical protein